jgi:Flp pilus assembly protein TadG
MAPSTEVEIRSSRHQGGQAIVLVAFMMVVLLGFVGLAIDSGHAYLDRREMQAGVDAAALAAAYRYMNTSDYTQSQQAAMGVFANNVRVYTTPSCSGYGTALATCAFNDPTSLSLQIAVASHSIAGVSFTATASHRIPVAMMQVLGSGPTVPVSTTATAVARRAGTNGAAIQTLSPAGCTGGGPGANSLSFTGTSTTVVTGDIWSNGSITDNGQANGSVNGNVIDICPAMPPSPLPNFTVSGAQATGWSMPDPGFTPPALSATPVSWNSTNGSTQQPGTYASNPNITNSNCYFLNGGVYDFQGGFKFNGGFVSNELRPPDEPSMVAAGQPNMTTTTAALSGSINAIPVNALAAAVVSAPNPNPPSTISVGGQTFTVANAGAPAGATSIPIVRQSVSGTIPSGSWLMVRAPYQFWDSNGVNCSTTFSLSSTAPSGTDPPVNAQTWAVELTAVRWAPNGVPGCTGPASPSCFLRESAPSMCQTLTVAANQVLKVSVSSSPADPGAQYFNVYLAPSGSCQGPFGYATQFANSGGYGVTINGSTLTGWALNPTGALDSSGAPAPDQEGMPLASGLPNANPAAGTPPRGDLANEGHCVDSSTGNNTACPGAVTPGAVVFYIPGPGSNTVCLNLQGGGDIYIFSGYQYQRILLYEPGPEQSPPANTCPNNVAGHGLTSLVGILYIPAVDVVITGNSQYLATIAGGVISYTATVKGNGGVSISVDPSLRTWPSAVRLTQ